MRLLYIELPKGATIENVCIKFAPINSSGDIYHMLAFIILSLHHHCEVPKIILTYDKEDRSDGTDAPIQKEVTTGTQCSRMINFATILGYKEHFLLEKIVHRAGHARVRESEIRKHLACVEYVIDHRMLTSIIGNYFSTSESQKPQSLRNAGFRRG